MSAYTFIDGCYNESYNVVPYDGDLVLVRDEDWFQIEKAQHDDITCWLPAEEPNCFSLYRSARISDASVEGSLDEMRHLAHAILNNAQETNHWRCAVAPHNEGFVFWSPRNSSTVGWVTAAVAQDLSKKILDM